MNLYNIKNLTYSYPNSEAPALDNVSIQIEQGETVLLVGASGCGKTTLLKLLGGLVPHFYGGVAGGQAKYNSTDLFKIKKPLAPEVALVFQDPEKQIIMNDVESELIFGLENTGVEPWIIKKRLGETISFMGIKKLCGEKTNQLSSGEKQKIVVGSVLAMNPDVILLDEPVSQLDPISSEEIMNAITGFARDLGKTIIMAEHKMERCLHFVDRVIAMEKGRIVFDGKVNEYCSWAYIRGFPFIPTIPRLFSKLDIQPIPITVKDAKKVIGRTTKEKIIYKRKKAKNNSDTPYFKITNLTFSYSGKKEVIKNLNLNAKKAEVIGIFGENGAGKTTLAMNICGLLNPIAGKIEIDGRKISNNENALLGRKIGYVVQNPDSYLFNNTVRDEILFNIRNMGIQWNNGIDKIIETLGLKGLTDSNPRDLSTGEKQRVVIASVLACEPDLIIFDEPTRGIDYINKAIVCGIIKELKCAGKTIILITHDIDFAVECCDKAVIMFEGEIIADGDIKEVLRNNIYYSSQISKIFDGRIITIDEAEKELSLNRGEPVSL